MSKRTNNPLKNAAKDGKKESVNMTVLLVEDNPAARLGVKLLLESYGYRVLEAVSLAEMFDIFALSVPDAVITDYDLGANQPNGLEVIRQIKIMMDDLPVMMYSANLCTDAGLEALARQAGACAVLPKPFQSDELKAMISHALDSVATS